MASEQIAIAAERKITAAEERALASNQRFIIAFKKVTAAEERAAAFEKRAISAEKKVHMAEERAIYAKKKVISAEERAISAEKKVISAEERVIAAEQRAVASLKDVTLAEEKVVAFEQKAIAAQEKVIAAEEKAVSCEQRAIAAEKKITNAHENAASFKQRTINAGKESANLKGRLFTVSQHLKAAEEHASIADENARKAEGAVKRLCNEKKSCDDKIIQLEGIINKAKQQIAALEGKVKNADAKIHVLLNERYKLEQTNNNLRVLCEDMRNQHSIALDSSKKSGEKLQEEILYMKDKVSILEISAIQAQQENHRLMSDCNCYKEMLAKAEDKAMQVDRRVEELLLQCKHLDKQLAQAHSPPWVLTKSDFALSDKEIGRGGWGVVKVAKFRGIDVAAKLLHRVILSDHNFKLFEREMNIASSVRHPNLLLFIGATVDKNEEPVILTELMDSSLRALLESKSHTLTQQDISSIGMDIAQALNYLHLMKPDAIIHRDVSSANVLLNKCGGSWKAKLSEYGSCNFARLVSTFVPGCISYAAPECLNPAMQSPKMDVFSFGILLLEMVSNEYPDIKTRLSLIEGINWPTVKSLIEGCTAQEPSSRPNFADILTRL